MTNTESRPAIAGNTNTESELRSLELSAIVPSLTNPRRFFNEPRLQLLAENIRAVGVMQPIVVRKLPASRMAETFADRKKGAPLPTHELIAGERRYRASKIAGLATIPAWERDMTDAQVLELQLVENLQRDDLHPMEEAEGYERLMNGTGMTVEQIAERIGKSKGLVYARIKLLKLTEKARKAFYDDEIDSSRALIIARIPDAGLQERALERATEKDWTGDGLAHTFREFAEWARREFMLPLDKAIFKITDATLVPDAGSCLACPKRTGAEPDIFADVKGKDTCTDPTCYRAKEAAYEKQTIAAARARGQEVIEGEEASKIWPSAYGELKGYKRVDVNDSRVGGKKALKNALGKDAPKPALLLSPHTGKFVEVLPTATVNKILQEKGVITAAQAEKDNDEAAARRLAIKFGREWRLRAIAQTYKAAAAHSSSGVSEVACRLVASMLANQLRSDDYVAIGKLIDLGAVSPHDALRDLIRTAEYKPLCDLIYLLLLHADMGWNDYELTAKDNHPRIDALAAEFSVDLKAIRAEVTAEQRAEIKAKADKKAAKVKPTAATPTPGADAPAAPKGKAKRTSKAEAAAAIAAEFQKLDQAQAQEPAGHPIAGWPVGQRVQFKDKLKGPGGKFRKVSGRAGTIKSIIQPGQYMVRLGIDPKDVARADGDELIELPPEEIVTVRPLLIGELVEVSKNCTSNRKYRGKRGKIFAISRVAGEPHYLVSVGGTNPCGFARADLTPVDQADENPAGDQGGPAVKRGGEDASDGERTPAGDHTTELRAAWPFPTFPPLTSEVDEEAQA